MLNVPSSSRRHDLDALRAVAMLMGIALHAALSFTPFPWPVQDSRQHGTFGLIFAAVHGFRMPLFFLLSGYFTAMLWRRRGLKELLWHRFRRVFLPCMLGLVTIVPAVTWVAGIGIQRGQEKAIASASEAGAPADLWAAARRGDLAAVYEHLAAGADANQPDPTLGTPPLTFATFANHPEVALVLIERGANVNAPDANGGTPLHAAALFGRAEVAAVLLKNGADVSARKKSGATPLVTMYAEWNLTRILGKLAGITLDQGEVNAGRLRVREQLRAHGAIFPSDDGSETRQRFISAFRAISFHHLWFLWFLCWLCIGFAGYAKIAEWLSWTRPPAWLLISPKRFLWLIPLTMLPQWVMSAGAPSFGPSTSTNILPAPAVLLYYAIFFGAGALYFDSDDADGRVGRRWRFTIPAALLVVFPLGLACSVASGGAQQNPNAAAALRLAGVALQVTYAWVMTFALMSLFRTEIKGESRGIRYLSDSSYWLYLAHLPLIMAAQILVRDWPLPAPLKFILVCVVVSALLLVSYETMVRYTWIGTLLNGRRTRPGPATRPASAEA